MGFLEKLFKKEVNGPTDSRVITEIIELYGSKAVYSEVDYDTMSKEGYSNFILFSSLNHITNAFNQLEFKVVLPENYHFTFLQEPAEGMGLVQEDNFVSWEIKNDLPNSIVFEYSWIPLMLGDFKGSYVFWITINLFLLVILFFEVIP